MTPYIMSRKFPVKYVLELNGEAISEGDTVLCPWCWRHYEYYIWSKFNTWYGCRKCCRRFEIEYGEPDCDDPIDIDAEQDLISNEIEERHRRDYREARDPTGDNKKNCQYIKAFPLNGVAILSEP